MSKFQFQFSRNSVRGIHKYPIFYVINRLFTKKLPVSLLVMLFAVTMVTGMSLQNTAFAADAGVTITVTASDGGDQISIDGYSGSAADKTVTISVIAPNGNIVTIDQISRDGSGNFATNISTGGTWTQDGTYTINIRAGTGALYDASFDVDVSGGVTSDTSLTIDNTGTTDDGYTTKMESTTEGSSGLSISADAVEGAISFTINGTTDRTESAVSIKVIAPNGNIVSIDQLTPGSDGAFSSDIGVGGPMWSQDGVYTVTAEQGDATAYQSTVEVEIADGAVIPEFGTIASLVLIVAISSIIVLSAKGRLSLTPKL